jgi:hypothetical protein
VRHHGVGSYHEVPGLVLRLEMFVRLCGAQVDALTLQHIDRGSRCGAVLAGRLPEMAKTGQGSCLFFFFPPARLGAETQ